MQQHNEHPLSVGKWVSSLTTKGKQCNKRLKKLKFCLWFNNDFKAMNQSMHKQSHRWIDKKRERGGRK